MKSYKELGIYNEASLLETESHLEMIMEIYSHESTQKLLEEYNIPGKKISTFINYSKTSLKTSKDK